METKKFGGYKSAVGAFLCIFVNLGVASTIGVFLPYLAEKINQPIGTVSLVVTIATLAAFVASFIIPKVNAKLGPKGTLGICLILAFPYFLMSAFAQNMAMLAIHGIAGGFFLSWGTTATCSIIVSNWFIEKRSSVLGVVLGGGAFGAAVFQMIAGTLCERAGVTTAYLVILVCAVVIPGLANLLLIRDPAKVGQKALGWEKAQQQTATAGELPGVPFGSALKSVSFWLCMIAIICCGPLITGFQTFATSYWRSFGMDGGAASTWVSIWSAIGCVATIILGQVANKLGNKVFMTIINVCYIIGMVFAIFWPANQMTSFIILAVLFVGFSYPLTTSVPATLCTESFGPKEYAKIVSWFVAALYLGKALASPLISGIVNATGSYVNAFVILAVLSGVSLILILVAIVASPYQKILRQQKN